MSKNIFELVKNGDLKVVEIELNKNINLVAEKDPEVIYNYCV